MSISKVFDLGLKQSKCFKIFLLPRYCGTSPLFRRLTIPKVRVKVRVRVSRVRVKFKVRVSRSRVSRVRASGPSEQRTAIRGVYPL